MKFCKNVNYMEPHLQFIIEDLIVIKEWIEMIDTLWSQVECRNDGSQFYCK